MLSQPYVQGNASFTTSSRLPRKRIETIDVDLAPLFIESTQVVTMIRGADGYVRVEVTEYEEERL